MAGIQGHELEGVLGDGGMGGNRELGVRGGKF